MRDSSGHEPRLDLRVSDPKNLRLSGGGLEIRGKTLIHSQKPATRLIEAIKQSGAITIEAWVRPANSSQSGPARIVTLSRDSNERNFTLGQDGERFEVRLRTTKTSTNGIPAVSSTSKSARAEWTHVVYTRNRAGSARIFIDGKLNREQTTPGAVSNWDTGFQLALANELSQDRPWLGTFRLVAICEVERNFRAGTENAAPSAREGLARQQEANVKRFETQVAPLLSKHCLECHDTLTKKGKLDLSNKAGALAGGGGGPVLTPGDAGQRRSSGASACSHEWWHDFDEKKKNEQLRAHAHMKMREVAYFLQRLAASECVEPNGKTILENSLVTISTESGDGRHNDVKRELSGIFHAVTSANGRFKSGQILDVAAEGIDVYNTMLEALDVSRRLGPAKREGRRVDSIRA